MEIIDSIIACPYISLFIITKEIEYETSSTPKECVFPNICLSVPEIHCCGGYQYECLRFISVLLVLGFYKYV